MFVEHTILAEQRKRKKNKKKIKKVIIYSSCSPLTMATDDLRPVLITYKNVMWVILLTFLRVSQTEKHFTFILKVLNKHNVLSYCYSGSIEFQPHALGISKRVSLLPEATVSVPRQLLKCKHANVVKYEVK